LRHTLASSYLPSPRRGGVGGGVLGLTGLASTGYTVRPGRRFLSVVSTAEMATEQAVTSNGNGQVLGQTETGQITDVRALPALAPKLAGKVALVTGSARGLGRAYAL